MTSNSNVTETDTNNPQIFFFTQVVADAEGHLSLNVYDSLGHLMSCNDEILDRLDASHEDEVVTMFVMGCSYKGEKCSPPTIYDTSGDEIATSPVWVQSAMSTENLERLHIEPITGMKWNAVKCTVATKLKFSVELTTAKGETLRNDPVADVDRSGSTGSTGGGSSQS